MRHFFTLLRHELKTLWISPSTYVAGFLFLLVMGFIFQSVVETFNQSAREGIPLVVFFQLFWLPVFFMVPLLTMKSLAEEKRNGTLETLLTTPVSTAETVFAKFGAAYLFYLFLWGTTAGFNFLLYHLAGDPRIVEPGAMTGGYLFISISGLLFIAIGIFASSITRNQLVAGILCFTLLFGLIVGSRYLDDLLHSGLHYLPISKTWVDYLQVFQHAEDFTRGVLDTRALAFYFSAAALFLAFTMMAVESKVWRS